MAKTLNQARKKFQKEWAHAVDNRANSSAWERRRKASIEYAVLIAKNQAGGIKRNSDALKLILKDKTSNKRFNVLLNTRNDGLSKEEIDKLNKEIDRMVKVRTRDKRNATLAKFKLAKFKFKSVKV